MQSTSTIQLSKSDKATLRKWLSAPTTSHGLCIRATILLALNSVQKHTLIAANLPVTAIQWRLPPNGERSMAEHAGVSQWQVRQIWNAFNIRPHLSKTSKISNDPNIAEKVVDRVGLYMNPPANALVLSVGATRFICGAFTSVADLKAKLNRFLRFTINIWLYRLSGLILQKNLVAVERAENVLPN